MSAIRSFIQSHPVLAYYLLTFSISWGGVYLLGSPYGMPAPSEPASKAWPVVFIPYFLGPSLSGLIMTGLIHGRAGFRQLWSRLTTWRVGWKWYAVALLTVPLVIIVILFLLTRLRPEFLPNILTTPDKISLIVTGLVVGLFFGGFLEELGWTGFAVPELRRSSSVFKTGLIVGVLWAVWHILPTFWASGDPTGKLDWMLFLPPCVFYIGSLVPYRIIMVWQYDHTRSLFVTMLMHATLSANTLWILMPGVLGADLMIYFAILSVALWGVVAAVELADRRKLVPAAA